MAIRGLDCPDVLSLLALTSWGDIELDLLAFLKRAVPAALDVGVMNEHVVTLFARYESEAFFRIEKLNCSCSQRLYYLSFLGTDRSGKSRRLEV